MEMINRCIENDAYARDFIKKLSQPTRETTSAATNLPGNRAERRALAKQQRAENRSAARVSKKAESR